MATEVTIRTNKQKATLNALTTIQRALMTISDQLSKTELNDLQGFDELFLVAQKYETKIADMRFLIHQDMRL